MRSRYTVFILVMFFCLLITPVQGSPVVLITGASRGIGYATAEFLANEGYIVYAGVRDTSSLQMRKKNCMNNFHALQLDVTDQRSIDLAVKKK